MENKKASHWLWMQQRINIGTTKKESKGKFSKLIFKPGQKFFIKRHVKYLLLQLTMTSCISLNFQTSSKSLNEKAEGNKNPN